ncbi:MAG: hypothetical protein U0354_08355 [Candidatus Sericytochromatia bacterium]
MTLEVGEVRFLTRVAEKSPRGLRLLLFKEKSTGNEKLVFIVKTASTDVDKLALSKMTWQVEQSKSAHRVVIVRLIILPEGAEEYFQSETGLIMNEEKDRKSLQALVNQKSVEIYFFTYENEFNSKIELMTTYNMHTAAKNLLEANPIIDEGRMIVKSENLSENDIKNAMAGKIRATPVKDKDLMDSIQKKMPTVTNSVPKTKPEEFNKTSVKSNDLLNKDDFDTTISNNNINNTKSELTADDLKKAVSVPPGKITPEDLLKSLPPNKKLADSIKSGDLFNSNVDFKSINADDLMKVVNTIPPGKITPDELLKSLPPVNSINLSNSSISSTNDLTTEELLQSLADTISADSNIKANDLLGTIKVPTEKIDQNNLSEILKADDNGFFDKTPTVNIDNSTKEMKVDDLLSALMAETSPLKLSVEEEKTLLNDLMSEPTPLKSEEGGNSELMKNLESNIKTTTTAVKKEEGISEDDLLKALNGEA